LKLLIKQVDTDGRLSRVPEFLDTPWDIAVVDPDDYAAFERALRGADAMISMSWKGRVPPAPNLRLLQLPGAGTDDIDFSLLDSRTAVCNCYEHEIGIAEYVLGAMLEWTIGVRKMDIGLRDGDWSGSHLCGPRHGELYGKTLGIVGYGRIGKEVALRAHGFGMQLRACSRTPSAGDALMNRVAGMEELDVLLAESDFILVAAPLTEDTRGLFGPQAFATMKPSAVVVNVARGAIIQEQALFDALRQKRIGGAIIDVWYNYPPQGRTTGQPSTLPFHELDNILMTPHASGWTDGLLPRRNRAIADNLNRLARGDPLANVVRAAAVAVRSG
jgi:phosphoglycerate dehydrogenase-like enzyme